MNFSKLFIAALIVISLLACKNKLSQEEIQNINHLNALINESKSLSSKIDYDKLEQFATRQKILFDSLKKLTSVEVFTDQELNIISNFYDTRKLYDFIDKHNDSIVNEDIRYSLKQIESLKEDYNNKLISKDLFYKYYQEEQLTCIELNNDISRLSDIYNDLSDYLSIYNQADSLFNARK